MKNKKHLVIPMIITAITAILVGLIAVGFWYNEVRNTDEQTSDIAPDKILGESKTDVSEDTAVPPIPDSSAPKDTTAPKAEVELDIGKIERETDPVLKDSKIEYGKKETETNE